MIWSLFSNPFVLQYPSLLITSYFIYLIYSSSSLFISCYFLMYSSLLQELFPSWAHFFLNSFFLISRVCLHPESRFLSMVRNYALFAWDKTNENSLSSLSLFQGSNVIFFVLGSSTYIYLISGGGSRAIEFIGFFSSFIFLVMVVLFTGWVEKNVQLKHF